jgi:UDP-4-amino-4,6-dideoxy-N-acetyl-beta-L-altrosamine transaminase
MKLIPLTIHSIDSSDIKEVSKVLRSDRLTQGKKIGEFENALCKYTGAKYAVCVSSATAALHIACLAVGIKQGDEVITSPITFVASANCVLYCGGEPVFADISADSGNIDPNQIREKITKNTKAVIPVHYAGNPVNLKEIYKIAKSKGLIVIEDAAHALGSTYLGKRIGSCRYSDMTVFSFHPTKSITTGEGGAVLTNDKKLYEKLLLLRSHGITRDQRFLKKNPGPWYYEMQALGLNYRMSDLQAALGISQLKKISRFIAKRKQIAKKYDEAFKHIDWIKPLKMKPGRETSYHLYVVSIDFKKIKKTRKQFMQSLKQSGIETQVHYIPVYQQPYYRTIMKVSCPRTENYYLTALSLPIFFGMKGKEVDYVIKQILRFKKAGK